MINPVMQKISDKIVQKYGVLPSDSDDNIIIDVTDSRDLNVNDITQYIMNFETYISRLKELHWSAVDDKTHILTDELIKKFTEYQDSLSEDYMGYCGNKFGIGFLSGACACDCVTLPELLKKLGEDTNLMYSVVNGDDYENNLKGIEHTLNEIMDTVNTYLYKETQK